MALQEEDGGASFEQIFAHKTYSGPVRVTQNSILFACTPQKEINDRVSTWECDTAHIPMLSFTNTSDVHVQSVGHHPDIQFSEFLIDSFR